MNGPGGSGYHLMVALEHQAHKLDTFIHPVMQVRRLGMAWLSDLLGILQLDLICSAWFQESKILTSMT